MTKADPDEPFSYFSTHYDMRQRTMNILERHGIRTPRQLSAMTREEFSSIRNVGQVTLDELTTLLYAHGLDWLRPKGDQRRLYSELDMRAAFEFGLGLYADGDVSEGGSYFPGWLVEYRKAMKK